MNFIGVKIKNMSHYIIMCSKSADHRPSSANKSVSWNLSCVLTQECLKCIVRSIIHHSSLAEITGSVLRLYKTVLGSHVWSPCVVFKMCRYCIICEQNSDYILSECWMCTIVLVTMIKVHFIMYLTS